MNPYDFRYEMTVYVQVNTPKQEKYEIAAFCGEDCRGVAQLQTVGEGVKYFYLRIRSNAASGEQIKFCVYNTVTDKEFWAEESVTFESQSLVGLPSNPMVLNIEDFQKGDVNNDGDVDIADAVCIVNYIVGKMNTTFVVSVADVNNDKEIDIADAVHIVNFAVGKINALAPKFDGNLSEPE
jgi:hypothetical protein